MLLADPKDEIDLENTSWLENSEKDMDFKDSKLIEMTSDVFQDQRRLGNGVIIPSQKTCKRCYVTIYRRHFDTTNAMEIYIQQRL